MNKQMYMYVYIYILFPHGALKIQRIFPVASTYLYIYIYIYVCIYIYIYTHMYTYLIYDNATYYIIMYTSYLHTSEYGQSPY